MEASEVAAMVGRVAERLYAEDYDEYNGIAEESVAEVMSWFELEIRLAAGAAVLPPPPHPPTPPGATVGRAVAERPYAEDYEHEGITEESESAAEVMSWLELEMWLAAGAAVLPLPPRPPTTPPVVGRVAAERPYAEYYDEHEGVAEDSDAEVMMSWLAAGAAVLPLPPRPPTPPGAALYVTVGGGRESCGPSLSGPASTVMASVDGRAGAPPPPAVPWPWPFPEPAAGNDEDADDDDDEWVSQLLTDGPAVEGLYGSP